MPVRVLYACCTGADLIKVVIGYILVKRGKWVVKIVDNVDIAQYPFDSDMMCS